MTPIHTLRKADSQQYPGVYHPPVFNWAKVMKQLQDTPSTQRKPVACISEDKDFYSIELNAPGYSKEDFIVTIEGGKLCIYGLSSTCNSDEQTEAHPQDKIYNCFEHLMELPGNIDSDFVRAEYKSGVLRFDFPKSDYADNCTVDRIIVY